jgi:hypothetical protein
MEDLKNHTIRKFHVTLSFKIDDEFMSFVPAHRQYIDKLISNNVIDNYTVSLQSQKSWIVMNAISKSQINSFLKKSPLHKYWTVEIDEIFVFDGIAYRLPDLQLN